MKEKIYLIHYGAFTPVESSAPTSIGPVICGFSQFGLDEDYLDQNWESIRLAKSRYLSPYLSNLEQFLALAEPALEEALTPLSKMPDLPSDIPLIVGLPEDRPGLAPNLESSLSEILKSVSEKYVHSVATSYIKEGHTSGLLALEQAREILQDKEFCIIGGVDSYDEESTIKWLELDKKRLFSSYNSDGFIPGQAAGFCLLANETALKRYQLPSHAELLAVASAEEPRDYDSMKNSSCEGLAQTVEKVLKQAPEERQIEQIYNSMNGENYHSREFAYLVLKNGNRFAAPAKYFAPYDCWGDLGAAIVPVLMAMASESATMEDMEGHLCLIHASSLGNSRASALLELRKNEC